MPQDAKPESRFKPLPEAEREVCLRFAAARRFEKLAQAQLAERLQVSRNRIANIEACRVPLKFWDGMKFCSELNISQLWLAAGQEPKAPYCELHPSHFAPRPSEQALFSQMCLGHLRPVLETRRRLVSAVTFRDRSADFLASTYDELFDKLLKALVFQIPVEARLDFIDTLTKTTKRFIREMARRPAGQKVEDLDLPELIEYGKTPIVKSEMAILLASLHEATCRHGMKSKLAKHMGVAPANISQWLSGEREPGGETTLKLLRWVERQERKENSPGRAQTQPEPKAQFSKSHYEKPKSGPRRRYQKRRASTK